MDVPVIDIRKRFGHKYRIVTDPAVGKYASHDKVDPMYWIIPCKYGEIFPFGHDYLAVMVTSIIVANRMRGWPELEVTQDADDAVIFKFHVDHFDKVAKRVIARYKRQPTEEQKKQIIERTKPYRFKKQIRSTD